MKGLGFVVCVMVGLCPLFAYAQTSPTTVTVQYVKDGDSFTLTTGQDVRLLDINAPEGPREATPAEPYADAARSALKQLIEGKTVTLIIGRKEVDKYGRLLAHVNVGNTWVNGEMVKRGLAVAYTFADNRERADDILKLEQSARASKTGLWSHPRWTVKDATTCCTPNELGLFQIIQGKVITTGRDKDSMYLNFGTDYRTDTTARILYRDLKWFRERDITDPQEFYAGRTIRLHGMAAPVYGVLVNVSHPEQIEVLDANGNVAPYAPRTDLSSVASAKGEAKAKPKTKSKSKKKKAE